MTNTAIRGLLPKPYPGGVEWFDTQIGPDCMCARCGSSVYRVSCHECGGDGYVSRYEEDPLWYDEDDLYPCHWCHGAGGWNVCMSSREWCEAHPMVNREHVQSSARTEEEMQWDD